MGVLSAENQERSSDERTPWGARTLRVLRLVILGCICVLAFFVRLFAVIRFESIIHEFDPYFNFRTTKALKDFGPYAWWNWYDRSSWYPLGRVVGQTLFPGLMMTAYLMSNLLDAVGLQIDIRDVCVFTAPIFAGFTSIAVYLLVSEVFPKSATPGLAAALLMALSPSYMSRSVAGSYDNEAVAIFALVFAFYAIARAYRVATSTAALFAAFAYAYMVAAWGGYVFIINTVAIHVVALCLLGRCTTRHYAMYCTFYIVGTLLCFNVPFVEAQAVTSSEHLSSHGVFLCLQVLFMFHAVRRYIPFPSIKPALRMQFTVALGVICSVVGYLIISGRTKFGGRSMTLLDPTYASRHMPIIASVSEHQPPLWNSYIFDLHLAVLIAPAGIWLVFVQAAKKKDGDTALLLGLYGVLAAYFSCVMVRLLLVLSPISCAFAGISLAAAIDAGVKAMRDGFPVIKMCSRRKVPMESLSTDAPVQRDSGRQDGREKAGSTSHQNKHEKGLKSSEDAVATGGLMRSFAGLMLLVLVLYLGTSYIAHGVFASAFAYSHPSVVISGYSNRGERIIQDDFREAYYWLRQNTHEDARILSWWDYGYQSASMANRTTVVDNNTWNNTHIATVGLALTLPEEESIRIVRGLDVDYVFVIFGAVARYQGDDLNKMLWMVRIAEGEFPDRIKESDFLTAEGRMDVGESGPKTLLNSLMYRLSYNNFATPITRGIDSVRGSVIPPLQPLKHFEEIYTTAHWIVRIYRVKKPEECIMLPDEPNRRVV